LLIDGEEVLRVGTPSPTINDAKPAYAPQVITFTPTNNRVELLFQVSNFDHRLGGLWDTILLGDPDQLRDLRYEKIAKDTLIFGAIMMMGIYSFALFLMRRNNRSALFLSLFCLAVSLRIMITGEQFALSLFPDFNYAILGKLNFLSWYLLIPTFGHFLYHLFPDEFDGLVLKVVDWTALALTVLIMISPMVFFSYTTLPMQFLTLVAAAYGAWCILLAINRRRTGATILLAGYIMLIIAAVHDLLQAGYYVMDSLWLGLGSLAFIISQTFLISYRQTMTMETVQRQHDELRATHIQLQTQEKLRKDAEEGFEILSQQVSRNEKMEAIGLLAGGVAHDLNNILSSTVTYPELALLDLPTDSPLVKPLEMTRQAGLRAAAVIQDLLTLTRQGIVQREVLNLNDIIRNYLRSVEHQLLIESHPGINVITELAPDLKAIEGSPVHLQKLLMNLISNALDAQQRGIINISTQNEEATERQLFFNKIERGSYVLLTLEDEGEGIKPDDLEKIFEPFYTTKVLGKSGTGLGMSVVKGVVQDHSGVVDVVSRKSHGTRFDIYIPSTDREIEEKPEPLPLESLIGNGEHLLVVDDMVDQRIMLEDVLRRLGYEVTSCGSGEEALKKIKETPFDLVILDMVMESGWDGLDTYLRINEYDTNLRVVFTSGFTETRRLAEARNRGAEAYLKKPFTIEALGEIVRSQLDKPKEPDEDH